MVELDDVTDDRQSDAQPAVRGVDARPLAEAVEDVRQELGAMPWPVSLTRIPTCLPTRSWRRRRGRRRA